jgi:GGDEF domain-containing protein
MRADGTAVLNRRLLPFVIGALGVLAGVLALVTSTPLLGLVAGVLALLAGAVAAAPDAGDDDREERIGQLERICAEQISQADETRAQLDQARRRIDELESELAVPRDAGHDGAATLTDRDTELFSEAYFRVALDARIASARRHLRPVAIALLDVREGLAATSTLAAPPTRAATSIRETIRDADTACRLADGTFAVILEDTPENGAVWTVERIRRNIVSRHGNHTMWAGVACYPAHAFSTEELLDQARLALTSAREWKQDRIEVAIAE